MPKRTDLKSILVIGAGPIVIGQACEFDYSGTQGAKALREEGYEVVLVNSNPATIMTDPEVADATYVEPLTAQMMEQVIAIEHPDAILPTVGGQTGLNLSVELAETGILEKHGMHMIGADLRAIRIAEDRSKFKAAMLASGVPVPHSHFVRSLEEAWTCIESIGYPALVRSDRKVNFTITFTEPPLVMVGDSPDDSAKIGSADYTDQGRAKVDAENTGLARLYAAAPDGRLIGADLFCPGADHMGHLLVLAIGQKITAGDLLDMPFYHPTLEEGLKGALREICRAVPLNVPGDHDTGNPPGV